MPRGDHSWIQTFTGCKFWPLDPRPEDVCIEDIAHSLSNQCRFSGHTREFYSVAQHSVHVSDAVETKDALWGLLHDASEAYLVDLPGPLKRSNLGVGFRVAEYVLMEVICEAFDLPKVQPMSVALADTRMLYTERRDLLAHVTEGGAWGDLVPPFKTVIQPCTPVEAEQTFLRLFLSLTSVIPVVS